MVVDRLEIEAKSFMDGCRSCGGWGMTVSAPFGVVAN